MVLLSYTVRAKDDISFLYFFVHRESDVCVRYISSDFFKLQDADVVFKST